MHPAFVERVRAAVEERLAKESQDQWTEHARGCLLYTSDAADERSSVDLGGRRIIKRKTHPKTRQ